MINTGPGRKNEEMVIYRGQEHQAEKFAHNLCVKHGFNKTIEVALASKVQHDIEDALLSNQKIFLNSNISVTEQLNKGSYKTRLP